MQHKRYLVIDTETNGLVATSGLRFPDYKNLKEYNNARIVQVAWTLNNGVSYDLVSDMIVKPDNFDITNDNIHGITKKFADAVGNKITDVFNVFKRDLEKCDFIVGHNVIFDLNVIKSELHRHNMKNIIDIINKKGIICTMEIGAQRFKNNKYGFIKLNELYEKLMNIPMIVKHDACYDVEMTCICFTKLFELLKDEKLDNELITFGQYKGLTFQQLRLMNDGYCQFMINKADSAAKNIMLFKRYLISLQPSPKPNPLILI
jgi:DNA polymerase-3 subunit alpha